MAVVITGSDEPPSEVALVQREERDLVVPGKNLHNQRDDV